MSLEGHVDALHHLVLARYRVVAALGQCADGLLSRILAARLPPEKKAFSVLAKPWKVRSKNSGINSLAAKRVRQAALCRCRCVPCGLSASGPRYPARSATACPACGLSPVCRKDSKSKPCPSRARGLADLNLHWPLHEGADGACRDDVCHWGKGLDCCLYKSFCLSTTSIAHQHASRIRTPWTRCLCPNNQLKLRMMCIRLGIFFCFVRLVLGISCASVPAGVPRISLPTKVFLRLARGSKFGFPEESAGDRQHGSRCPALLRVQRGKVRSF